MPSDTKRSFSEEEVGKLISRAIARQEADQALKKQHEGGLSLEEVRQVALDAGIDPRYITLAVADLTSELPTPNKGRFFGAPAKIERETLIPGRLSTDQMGELVNQIRLTISPDHPIPGTHQIIGQTFEWSTPAMGSARSILIRCTPEGDDTRLTYREDTTGLIVLFHLWWMILLPMSALFFAVGLPKIVPIILFLVSLLIYFGGRLAIQKIHSHNTREADRLLEKLDAIAAMHTSSDEETTDESPVLIAPVSAPDAKLTLPAETDLAAEPTPRRRRTTRRS